MSQAAQSSSVQAGERGSATSGPSKIQRSLYQFIAGRLPVSQPSLRRYPIRDSFSEHYWAASGVLQNSKSARLTVSLPELSHTVFLCVSGGLTAVFEQLLCDISAKSECNDAYQAGYAHRLVDHTLNQFGWQALLFVNAKEFFNKIPESLNIGGEVFDFILVLPITETEYDLWASKGYEVLRSYFGQHKRGLLDGHRRLALVQDQPPEKSSAARYSSPRHVPRINPQALLDAALAAEAEGAQGQTTRSQELADEQAPELPTTAHGRSDASHRQQMDANAQSNQIESPAAQAGDEEDISAEHTDDSVHESSQRFAHRKLQSARKDPASVQAAQLASLHALEQRTHYLSIANKVALSAAGLATLLGAMAMGLLPALLAGAGALVLVGAYRDFKG